VGRPAAVKMEDFQKIKERLFDKTGCLNGSQLARYMEVHPPAVTRQFKQEKIPDHWFRLIAEKTNIPESYLRYGTPLKEANTGDLDAPQNYQATSSVPAERETILALKELLLAKDKIITLLESKDACGNDHKKPNGKMSPDGSGNSGDPLKTSQHA